VNSGDASRLLQGAVDEYSAVLEANGFHAIARESSGDPWEWESEVSGERVRLRVDDRFPFAVPRVYLPDRDGRSWHRESDGALCLWLESDRPSRPWLDPARLRAKIEEWIAADAAGWTGEPPALDVEAYLDLDASLRVLQIPEWDGVADRWMLLTPDPILGRRLDIARVVEASASIPKKRDVIIGRALDIGDLAAPLRDWSDLSRLLPDDVRNDLVLWSRVRGEVVLAVRYRLAAKQGTFAAILRSVEGVPELKGLILADSSSAERAIRGGAERDLLALKGAAIIGVGAVGSFLADGLARAGVGRVCVIDIDTLLPGNLVRHLCGPALVGWPKSSAVKVQIDRQKYPGDPKVEARITGVSDFPTAVALLEEFDLVIDATADGLVAHLMGEAALAANRSYLAVAVEGHGQYARIDHCPTPPGSEPLPTDGVEPVELLEAINCGDPLSPTPPHAAIATAAVATGAALDLLSGADIGAGRRVELRSR
jgi:molybdopterin/thiamine biosynthesis adenylyltransferase